MEHNYCYASDVKRSMTIKETNMAGKILDYTYIFMYQTSIIIRGWSHVIAILRAVA